MTEELKRSRSWRTAAAGTVAAVALVAGAVPASAAEQPVDSPATADVALQTTAGTVELDLAGRAGGTWDDETGEISELNLDFGEGDLTISMDVDLLPDPVDVEIGYAVRAAGDGEVEADGDGAKADLDFEVVITSLSALEIPIYGGDGNCGFGAALNMKGTYDAETGLVTLNSGDATWPVDFPEGLDCGTAPIPGVDLAGMLREAFEGVDVPELTFTLGVVEGEDPGDDTEDPADDGDDPGDDDETPAPVAPAAPATPVVAAPTYVG